MRRLESPRCSSSPAQPTQQREASPAQPIQQQEQKAKHDRDEEQAVAQHQRQQQEQRKSQEPQSSFVILPKQRNDTAFSNTDTEDEQSFSLASSLVTDREI
jgi:hypothetical protein